MAANILINPQEGRLRALWRIILQAIFFLSGSALISIGIVLVGLIGLIASGANLQNAQLYQSIARSPALQVAGALTSLLVMLVSYWLAARWLDHRPWQAFGFHFGPRWWQDFGFGLVLGAALMTFIFFAERAAGWLTVNTVVHPPLTGIRFWGGILTYLVIFFCVGIYEEMLSRGYQLRNLAEGLNFRPLNPRIALLLAYLLSSSLFGLLHLANPNTSLISTLNLIIAGLFLGLGYVLTGELAISIGLHMTWNFFQGCVFGFPVSGTSTGASFMTIQQNGPAAWTGGAFGPEAGLIGLTAIGLGCLLTVLWVYLKDGKVGLKDGLAIYPAKTGTPETNAEMRQAEISSAP